MGCPQVYVIYEGVSVPVATFHQQFVRELLEEAKCQNPRLKYDEYTVLHASVDPEGRQADSRIGLGDYVPYGLGYKSIVIG
jgi:hypothetical protein